MPKVFTFSALQNQDVFALERAPPLSPTSFDEERYQREQRQKEIEKESKRGNASDEARQNTANINRMKRKNKERRSVLNDTESALCIILERALSIQWLIIKSIKPSLRSAILNLIEFRIVGEEMERQRIERLPKSKWLRTARNIDDDDDIDDDEPTKESIQAKQLLLANLAAVRVKLKMCEGQ
ncbi:MAG: hypothetical protein EZS28_006235 [Streblomastix strix]|uniref:Uncharacterized protein n=1 Tax=Streblomastix strix TaxID=222440 RepID=A0A5J4WTD5_9EUKA|nr:MAG: hypothetical protein EZS28_006235 [Streblomastix strix]